MKTATVRKPVSRSVQTPAKPKAKAKVIPMTPERARALKAWETMRAKGIKPGAPKPKRPTPNLPPPTPIKMPKQSATVDAKQMMLRTTVLVVTISGIGNRRKVNLESINITAKGNRNVEQSQKVDDQWLGVTKKLFDAEELDEITSIGNEARQWVENHALPFHIKRGVYLLPKEFQEETNAKLKEFDARRKPLVEQLIKKLDHYKTEAKDRLKDLFDAEQYPTPDKLRAAFSLTWRFLYVDSAQGLSKELYDEERKKAEAAWAETRDAIQQMLRAQFQEKVNHFIERLTPNPDGRPKIFREGSLDKFNEFLSTFEPRNITNDMQMKILVDKARGLLSTGDTELLRTDKAVRDYVLHGFETIQALLDPMVTDKPHRRIILEES